MLLAVAIGVAACNRVDNAEHAPAMRELVARQPAWVDDDALGKRLWKIEQAFYESREYLPAWVDGNETTPQWKELVAQLRYAEAHGLDPSAYGVEDFEALREASQTRFSGTRFPVEAVPELDAKMTYAYLRHAADLLGWTRSARAVHRDWQAAPKKEDLAARLTDALAAGRVRASLEDLAPTHPQYKGLQAALAGEEGASPDRAERIRMNLERWRWAPRDLGDRHILVNVPAYQMQVVEGDAPVLSMRVIVGDPESQTPLFSDEMTYVVFSPYWNIPSSILRDETLPRAAEDPEYLLRNNIEVLGPDGEETIDPSTIDWSSEDATKGLRFRQAPGPENALGLVKFIFPNHFSVYLHDTPSDKLFFEEQRALSHGCVRVERPVDLAKYVLRDRPGWTEERITDAMSRDREETVKLKEPLPVHLGYWTAWVGPDGKTVTYTDDPYGIDAKHARARGTAATEGLLAGMSR